MCQTCGMYVCLQLLVLFHLVVVTDCQAVSASERRCYNTATCPCCNVGACPSDGSGQCGANCIDGYHGGKCRNRCPANCVRCVDAPQGGGVANCTQCKGGHYSTPTQYQCQLSCPSGCPTCASATLCTSCRDGYYLSASQRCVKCNESCSTCYSGHVCTACENGYFLEHGEGLCTKCNPLCGTCTSPGSCICSNGCYLNECNQTTSVCTYGCKYSNFTPGPLSKCDTCRDSMYGYQCDSNCSVNCESTCDRITGICITCKPGFHGIYCDNDCPENCVSTCNRTTGDCFTCKEGYFGDECTLDCRNNCRECTITEGTCTICVDGYYGDTCDKTCSDNCLTSKCNKNNGSCGCVPWYAGDTCQLKVTTSTSSPSDKLPLVVASTPESYVGETIGITLASVVVIAGVVCGLIFLYRRRKLCFMRENLPAVTFNARITDETKLKAELASINEEITTLTERIDSAMERRVQVETQLQELDRQMPYRHTDRADVMTTDNEYEDLQRKQPDDGHGHYSTIKY